MAVVEEAKDRCVRSQNEGMKMKEQLISVDRAACSALWNANTTAAQMS